MRIAFVVHSVASCWNQGNAHFLRGVVTALQGKGHEVAVFEPATGWSRQNLVADAGLAALEDFAAAFRTIQPTLYEGTGDVLEKLADFDPNLTVVHEWNEPALVNAIGLARKRGSRGTLLFHDTHHRAVSKPEELARFDLSGYDGILAFGAVIADIYERRGWGSRAFVWHEAADTRLFHPIDAPKEGDLVWVGNWGDDERSDELRSFLLEPASALGLGTTIYGVRYPETALAELDRRGIHYGGFLPNYRAPEVFARYRATVHVPRRHYAETLHGIPTIRVFEALACGIPLVSAPWKDTEGLFPDGAYLTARSEEEMTRQLRAVLNDPELANSLTATGLITIATRHTCDHRADELLTIAGVIESADASTAGIRAEEARAAS